MRCKNKQDACKSEATEESGYCFSCAEELACMLHELAQEFPEYDIDPSSAYRAQKRGK